MGERRSVNAGTIAEAFRLTVEDDADRIAVLDRGRLVELGSHAQLLERRGLYHALWSASLAWAADGEGR